MKSRYFATAFGLTLLLGAGPGPAQVSRAVLPDEVCVTMIAADGQPASGGAGLGLGPMSFFDAQSRRIKGPGASKAFVVSRRVRLRLERRSGAPGSVRLSASLARDCAPLKLTLDGVVLRTEPAVIAPHVSLNSATAHTVELEIPASAPAGPVDAEIIWQVEDN